jgi:hypothetical protein
MALVFVLAEARVKPATSSINWAYMCLVERNTDNLGFSGVPRTDLRT